MLIVAVEKTGQGDPPPYIPFPPIPILADFYPENIILSGIDVAILIGI